MCIVHIHHILTINTRLMPIIGQSEPFWHNVRMIKKMQCLRDIRRFIVHVVINVVGLEMTNKKSIQETQQTAALEGQRSQPDGGRGHRSVERLDKFAARAGAPRPKGIPERRGKRKTTADIFVPKQQVNINALRVLLRGVDVFFITTLIMLSVWSGYVGINDNGLLAPLAAGLLGAVSFTLMLFVTKAHHFPASERYGEHMGRVGIASAAALGVWLSAALIYKPDTFLPDFLAKSGLIATAALAILHTLYYRYVSRRHKEGALAPTIVMLGATESARRLIEENAKSRELNILAIFDDRISRAPLNIHGVPVVGKVEDLMEWADLPYVDRIVVTLPSMAQARKDHFVKQVRLLPNRIAFVVDEFENLDHVQQRISQIAEVGMREVSGKPRSGRQVVLKRAMDLFISVLALIGLLPILAIVALLIKKDSPGPILFKQPRHGFNNRVFQVYKFRSMRNDMADLKAAQQTVAGDARVTKIGRFIRKTSIDELPQLLNVIKGEMSLVGPRPHAIGMRTEGKDSMELVSEYAHRHKVKPGMTGWAQINGSRGPLHNAADVARRVQLDVEYIERSSIWFDFVIIVKTLPCLLGDSENIR